ncbi:WD40 repeat-like protein [Ophiobolus disseminans]|uniref:WD40 repeat-like protein n=1 Tax=Ophiobolus disseminans TaxID=1469910 RepID=A0A6A6ZHY9_9PLEO|nr:WD40 repeat-like protein [Ophiobolus disseminans]
MKCLRGALSSSSASTNGFDGDKIDTQRKQEECLRDLCATNPCNDKKRIEDTKGGLLADSYRWVKGNPGKGKTMLLCGIIDELQRSMPRSALLSYFFCQQTDSRINNATAVLRGLLYMLVQQQPSLVSHTDVLQDPRLNTTYLVIDALDECVSNLLKLLSFITEQSSTSSRVKWILERAGHKVNLSLELNAQSVATAVDVFIQQKVDCLAREKQYKAEVALVCQDLESTLKWNVISESNCSEIYLQILALTAILYRPVSVPELAALVEQLEDLDDLESVREIVSFCGLFLTLREDTVYFAYSDAFPNRSEAVHRAIFLRSLVILSKTLHRDIYSLEAPGYPIKNVKLPETDPLAVLQYPLCKSVGKGVVLMEKLWLLVQLVQDARQFIMYHKGAIEGYPLQTYASALLFSPTRSLIRQLFQHEELEAISIRPALSDGWSACLQTLEGHSSMVNSVAFSHDSMRLASASYDRTVKIWDASSGTCLQTLEGHSDAVRSVAFSHDSTRLASASDDRTVKIWDASSGACLQTLKGHSSYVSSVAFLHDSTRLASASWDRTVKIWDASSGTCLQTLKGYSSCVSSVAFSHNSTRLALASDNRTVKIWDTSSGACLQTLKGYSSHVSSVAFSHNSTRLASASDDRTVKIWDASSGACLQTLKGYSSYVSLVAFSHNSTRLASASWDRTVKIWDASSGACLQTLKGYSDAVRSVAFSHNSTRLASASDDSTVKIWDASSGACLQTLEGHSDAVRSVAFSHDSTRLASASNDSTVKIWDASSSACLQTLKGHSNAVRSVAFSHDSTRLASASWDSTVKIWDASSGTIDNLVGFKTQQPLDQGIAISLDTIWVTYNDQKQLWLPSEYRPFCSAVSGRCFSTGTGSGKVWIYCLK